MEVAPTHSHPLVPNSNSEGKYNTLGAPVVRVWPGEALLEHIKMCLQGIGEYFNIARLFSHSLLFASRGMIISLSLTVCLPAYLSVCCENINPKTVRYICRRLHMTTSFSESLKTMKIWDESA